MTHCYDCGDKLIGARIAALIALERTDKNYTCLECQKYREKDGRFTKTKMYTHGVTRCDEIELVTSVLNQ